MAFPPTVLSPLAGGGGRGGNRPPTVPPEYQFEVAGEGQGPGALVPMSFYQQTAAPVSARVIDGAGQAAQANSGFFDALLKSIGAIPGIKYAPGIAVTAGQVAQGDIGGAIGAGFGTAVGGKLAGRALQSVAASLPPSGPTALLAKAGLYGVGTLLGSSLGAQLGKGVGAIGNQLVGGAQAATRDVVGAVTSAQREAGQSGITGREAGLGGASQTELDRQTALLKQLGVNIPTEALNAQYQITQKYKDADLGRQMQANQQLAQLTGALNRQTATYQIGSQALGETSATTRQILASNPYQASVLNTGNVRGIY